MRYLTTPLAFLFVFFVAACGADVPGYADLDLAPPDQARKEVFEAGAMYQPVQIVLEQVVVDPTISPTLKAAIQAVDREATGAVKDYRDAVAQFGSNADATTVRLTAFIAILGRAQALLIEAQTEGLL